jgi:predicted alpha/beta superfamily hydrolase
MNHPEIFGNMMIFSPSLWISKKIYQLALKFEPRDFTDIYLYAGGMESANHFAQVSEFYEILRSKKHLPHLDVVFSHNPIGQHKEIHWGQQFPIALKWLYFSKF